VASFSKTLSPGCALGGSVPHARDLAAGVDKQSADLQHATLKPDRNMSVCRAAFDSHIDTIRQAA